jgi:hypothetical protein
MALRWRKLRWLIALLLAVVVAGLVLAFCLRGLVRDGVNRFNYELVEVGMTRTQVEAIMGGPGGDLPWVAQEDIAVDERIELLLRSPRDKPEVWQSGNHQLEVWYNAHGEVVSKAYQRHPESGLLERFFDWLGM